MLRYSTLLVLAIPTEKDENIDYPQQEKRKIKLY